MTAWYQSSRFYYLQTWGGDFVSLGLVYFTLFYFGFCFKSMIGCIDTHASCRCIVHDIDVWVVAFMWLYVYSLYALLLHWGYVSGRHYTFSGFSWHWLLAERRRLRIIYFIRRELFLELDLSIIDDLSFLILTVVSPVDAWVIRRDWWRSFWV